MTAIPPESDPQSPLQPPGSTPWSPGPYPPGGQQPGAYGALPFGGHGRPLIEHPNGTTVLVLGILALVVCPVTGIFAITMGGRALKEIDADPGAYANRQSVVVGRVLGIVAVAVYGAILALYVAVALGMFAFFAENR
jgi:hypothetical protein